MKKNIKLFTLFLISVFHTSCGQNQTEARKIIINSENKEVIVSQGPKAISRNIIQDKKGNIWVAAFDGIFRYDGKSFANMTSKVTSSRFFSVLEDRKGNFWFGTVGVDGTGVYYYDGKSFQNFTTKEGLLNNEVGSIYEDKKGNIWFGVSGGVSCYDGKSFRNYVIKGSDMNLDWTRIAFLNRQPYEVNAVVEDKKGTFWFASRGNTFVYDGKTFNVFMHDGKPFKNVRSIIEDKKGNIWLSGNDGLWRYDGNTLTNFTNRFVGYIMEDKKGNIWIGSEKGSNLGWTLSKYDVTTLSNYKPTVTDIATKPMIFGILEANDGSIWFGDVDGVHRYDGKTITDFKN
jgi:ligand-binding sensor domain-containing protein